jgi:hypothetical protein
MERARDVLRLIEPHADSLVCYASTMSEYAPNRIPIDIQTALVALDAALAAPTLEQPAAVDAVGKDCHVAVIGFRWDSEKLQHVPQLLIEFEPVPAGSPNDAKGWRDRDAMVAALARSGKGA